MKVKTKSDIHIHLERELSILGFHKALKALDLVVEEMCAEKGFKRHDGSHYYVHLINVAQLLLNFGFKYDEDLITAALLHDIIEDVEGYSKKLIEREFGENVANIVWQVTKKKGIDYKNNPLEMNYYLYGVKVEDITEYFKQLELIDEEFANDDCIFNYWQACLIKVADRMHNFSTLKDSSLKHRKAQLNDTLTHFIPFFKYCSELYIRHEAFYSYAKALIEPIANEISRYIEDFEVLEKELNELKEKCKV